MAASLASQIYGPMTISPPTISLSSGHLYFYTCAGTFCQLICLHALSLYLDVEILCSSLNFHIPSAFAFT